MVRHFPKGFTPNVNQKLALERIDEAFNNGVKFVVVQGPTGCGKSYIAKAVANSTSPIPQVLRDRINDYSAYNVKWSNGEFDYEYADDFNEKGYGASILTTTKNLQDQYERDFKDIESLKGKNSYICNLNNRDTADNAPCAVSTNVKRACWDCKQCDYYEQRNKSISSKISIENYSSFFHKPDHLKNREIIICDEASELEDVIVSRFSCILEHGKLRKHDLSIRYTDNRRVFKERLLDLYEDVKMKYDQARKIITTHENNQKDIVPTVKDSTRQSYKFLGDLKKNQEKAISYAAYRLLVHRYEISPGYKKSKIIIDSLFKKLGYNNNFKSLDYQSGDPAALGNYIAKKIIDYSWNDGSNEKYFYTNLFYEPINKPLILKNPGIKNLNDPNRWQPLAFEKFIDQSGNELAGSVPEFLGPEWGQVFPFSLDKKNLKIMKRDGYKYPIYFDPGTPPQLTNSEKKLNPELNKL